MVLPGFTSYVKKASVPEVLHIQQVSDAWWAINASNGYDVPIMPQSLLQVKCYQLSSHPSWSSVRKYREYIHKLDPPQSAGPLIFPLHIFITLTRTTLKYTATFLKSSVSSI